MTRNSLTCTVTILERIVYTGGMKTETAPRIRLVAYGRVSTSGQMDGYGPDVQEKAMRKWARTHKHTIVDVLFDGAVSGTVDGDERPALAEALAMVADGRADAVLIPNLDRLARELTVQEGALTVVWAHGGRVFAVDQGEILPDDTDDPMRTFVRQVMGAAAQLERGLIAKRLKSGRAAKKAAGGYAGGAPAYGQRAADGGLETDENEAAALAAAEQMREDGVSLRAIAAQLNEDGVPTKRGGRWHPNTVARLLDPAAREADNARAAAARDRKRLESKARKAAKLTARVAG